MKTLILFFLIVPVLSIAQQNESSAIKVTGLSIPELVKGLLESGYAIKKSEGSLQFIFTAPRKLEHSHVFTLLKAEIKKDGIVLYSQYTEDQNTEPEKKATSNQNNASSLHCWHELKKLASSFNKPVEYLSN